MTAPRPRIMLANPRGFCAGVDRAIEIVQRLVDRHGPPIYVKHEVVHNRSVIRRFEEQGVRFVEDPAEVPEGSVLVYSAHGVSLAVRAAAEARGLAIHDATCPLVSKVHAEVRRLHRCGHEIVMVGHAGHPEVEGTLGQVPDRIHLVEDLGDVARLRIRDPARVALVTQTTLSVDQTRGIVDALRLRFPAIRLPRTSDICYATQNRQDAVKALAAECDLLLVVGSPASSNSNRLCEVGRDLGVEARLVDGPDDIRAEWLAGRGTVGLTAGASAPEELVQAVARRIREIRPGCEVAEVPGAEENVSFAVPRALLAAGQGAGAGAGAD